MYSPIQGPVTFTYRAGLRFQLGLALALFILFLASIVLASDMQQEDWLFAGVFALFLPWMGWQFIRHGGSLTIDNLGLRRAGLFGSETSLAWSDLAVQRSALRTGLLLSDSMNSARIEIDPELEGFPAAVELVRQSRPDLWRAQIGDYRKRFSLLPLGLVIGFSLIITIALFYLFIQDDTGQAVWLGLLFPVIMVVVIAGLTLRLPLELRLQANEIAVRFITGEKRFRGDQVADITLEVQYAGRSGRMAVINIRSFQGGIVKLSGQFGGGAEAYCLIKTWLEEWRKGLAATR